MKRISAIIAAIALAATVAFTGPAASAATWTPRVAKKAVVEPMPDWGPGWCFVRSGSGWLGSACPVKR